MEQPRAECSYFKSSYHYYVIFFLLPCGSGWRCIDWALPGKMRSSTCEFYFTSIFHDATSYICNDKLLLTANICEHVYDSRWPQVFFISIARKFKVELSVLLRCEPQTKHNYFKLPVPFLPVTIRHILHMLTSSPWVTADWPFSFP